MRPYLLARLSAARGDLQRAGRILRRARHLYAWVIHTDVLEDETGFILERCARRMLECGFYVETRSVRDVRFSILRCMWKIERREGCRMDWHEWRREYGYDNWDFERRIA